MITTKYILRYLILTLYLIGSWAHSAEVAHKETPLNQLTLKVAEDLWLQKNHDLQLATNQIESAKADTLTASQRPNPQLSYSLNNVGTGRDHRYLNGSDHVVRIDQTFERGDKRALRMQSADFMLHASEADLLNIKRESKTQLYQLYYQLLLAQEKLRIVEENVSLYQKTIEASELRLKAGDIAASELSRLDLDKLRADNDVFQARNNLKQAQIDLAIFIGEELNAPAIVAADVSRRMPRMATTPKIPRAILSPPKSASSRRRLLCVVRTRRGFPPEKHRDIAHLHHQGASGLLRDLRRDAGLAHAEGAANRVLYDILSRHDRRALGHQGAAPALEAIANQLNARAGQAPTHNGRMDDPASIPRSGQTAQPPLPPGPHRAMQPRS